MTETVRARRVRERRGSGPKQMPWRRVENSFRPIDVLSPDQVERIHLASLKLLADFGLEFQNDEALKILAANGAKVDLDSRMVRFPAEVVEHFIAKAPAKAEVFSWNPAKRMGVGGREIAFGTVGGPPNCSDLERGRRPGTYQDQCDLIRLEQCLNVLHFCGGAPVEAIDLPAETRHLDTAFAFLTLTDRPFFGRAIGGTRIADAMAMAAIARGVDVAELAQEPAIMSVISVNSPRRVDKEMVSGLLQLVRSRQPAIVTPFTLQGAMSPVTLAGALVQQNAEALGVLAFAQMASPGAPVVYGGFTSNVDMRSGAPAFGTPEYARAAIAGGQLARRYNLPYRTSNVNASNAVDAQAAYESEMSLWAAVTGGGNLIHHGAGWLEGGLCASFEKMVLDAEMMQMMAEFVKPVLIDDAEIGLSAHGEVSAGGHFFGSAHTLERFETAFYQPMVSDWRNYESWREAGSIDATQRAHQIWKELLAHYEPPPLDVAKKDALVDYVARRKVEIAKTGLD
jgi:trimethylamine--corrinoid protein Co-methyltransferase